METIIASAITAIVTLAVCLINGHIQMEKTRAMNEAQNEKTRALLDYRLSQLEKKQDKHNSVIERTFHLETEAELFREQIKVANHRIQDLEDKRS